MVLSVEAKQVAPHRWEAYTHNGREPTGLDVIEWVERGVELGAGEVLVTSVDREGTRKGFDVGLVKAVSSTISVPVIASGGLGKPSDLVDVVSLGGADGVAMADVLHYGRETIGGLRSVAEASGIRVRAYESA
jgi:cyclase